MDMIENKAHWNNIKFIKVPKSFASTQICSNCKEKNKNISGLRKIGNTKLENAQNAENTITETSTQL